MFPERGKPHNVRTFGLGFIVILTTILPLFQATSTFQLTTHNTPLAASSWSTDTHTSKFTPVVLFPQSNPIFILHVIIITSTDDKIKRVDSIKVTFVNPFHHSELDKWISQCYRNNDLKCIVQGISKYSQLYTLRDAVIEKWGLTYFVGYWKIEGSTCSGSMKHYFIFELQPSGTSLGVDFSNTLMELCEKEHWERHTLKKLWLKLGQMIANEADNISSEQHSPSG
uniref:Uncharacterized protein n=1 Tax=Timema genevievae TaxID=629358 RepID=A0A7R9K5U2_TIMGE|nr:unnamed protein product [Timema genevievae]